MEPLLEGFIINNLISCFAKSVQPNSPGSRKKMLWYSASRAHAAAWFLSDHPSRPDKYSCWKSTSVICSTDILVPWIPCISSNFSRVLGATSTEGTAFAATTWVTLTPLAIVIGTAFRFFTTTATHLLPKIILVYVFTTLKSWGKWGPSPPPRDWVITCMLIPRSRCFVWLCIIMDEKVPTPSFFVILTTSFKSVRSTGWFVAFTPEFKVLLANMPTNGLYSIHSRKLATHWFYFPWIHWWYAWWSVFPE